MSENSSEQEPSIEEILASIRQIISDDEEEAPAAAAEPAAEPAAAEPAPEPAAAAPAPEPEPQAAQSAVDDVFELTDKVEEPAAAAEEPAPKPRVEIDLREPDAAADGGVLTDNAAGAALQGFMKLASNTAVERMGTGNVTLEDIVRELMHPMLREWLDANLPMIIEKVVQKELDKIARKAIDE